jgi:hypothetical protein
LSFGPRQPLPSGVWLQSGCTATAAFRYFRQQGGGIGIAGGGRVLQHFRQFPARVVLPPNPPADRIDVPREGKVAVDLALLRLHPLFARSNALPNSSAVALGNRAAAACITPRAPSPLPRLDAKKFSSSGFVIALSQ